MNMSFSLVLASLRDKHNIFVPRARRINSIRHARSTGRGNLVRDMNIVNIEMEFKKYVEN